MPSTSGGAGRERGEGQPQGGARPPSHNPGPGIKRTCEHAVHRSKRNCLGTHRLPGWGYVLDDISKGAEEKLVGFEAIVDGSHLRIPVAVRSENKNEHGAVPSIEYITRSDTSNAHVKEIRQKISRTPCWPFTW